MREAKEKLWGSHGHWRGELGGKTEPWAENGQEGAAGARPWRTLWVGLKVVFSLRMMGSYCKL